MLTKEENLRGGIESTPTTNKNGFSVLLTGTNVKIILGIINMIHKQSVYKTTSTIYIVCLDYIEDSLLIPIKNLIGELEENQDQARIG